MKPDIADLYEHVGNLFYSFAADRGMSDLDIGELKSMIASYWLPRTTEHTWPLVTSEGHRILLAIDALQKERVSASDAYRDFEKFYLVYPEVFTAELKRIILETAKQICDRFDRKNRVFALRTESLHDLMYPAEYNQA